MLGATAGPVFSKRAVLRATVRAEDARGNQRMLRSRRVLRTVGGGRHAIGPSEGGGERANTPKADGEANVGDAAVSRAQKGRGTLQAPGEQVRVWRFAEGSP